MISVIIPIGGGRPERQQRFWVYLRDTLAQQTYKDFEIIVVEQVLDGFEYYKNYLLENHICRYISIVDPLGRGFNESWAYNVGARVAYGDILGLLGMDFVFGADLLEHASKIENFSFACNECVFATQAETDSFYASRDVDWLLQQSGYARFTPKLGAAVGVCFVRKELYFDAYGGWIEDFVGWGAHDKIFGNMVAYAEKCPMNQLPMLPHKIVHLCHDKERKLDLVNEQSDYLYKKCHEIGFDRLRNMNQNAGNKEHPHLILL